MPITQPSNRSPPTFTPCRKARLLRVLKAAAPPNAKGSLPPKAASELADALRRCVFDAGALQKKVDAYTAAAWAALGPSYLEVRRRLLA